MLKNKTVHTILQQLQAATDELEDLQTDYLGEVGDVAELERQYIEQALKNIQEHKKNLRKLLDE